jgi:hypothetical protein
MASKGKSVFDTIAGASYNPTGSGNYFRRGDYEVSVKVSKIRESEDPRKKGNEFFVFEAQVDKVVLAYDDSQKVGETASVVRNLTDDPYGFGVGDAKACVAAMLGVDINALTGEDVAGALGGDGTDLAGTPIKVHCYRKVKKDKSTIDVCMFASMLEDMPEGDGSAA